MLKLKNIVKEYDIGDSKVTALKGIDLEFRKNEFVSILGPSGCGKTTMLNIIGGLDRYSSGDLIISGKSTKQYKDSDWDTYRNHTIGFVFQSYNLIPHQSVLSNVELALTLSGVSKTERKKRATDALIKVGLGDQLDKKPNQMSGGQMQRVAIARALVNNPEILLADEPTGALDSETSVQVMDILKEVAKDRLVIMVTHNPELAEKYSTRIIKLFDGRVVGDSDPIEEEIDEKKDGKKQKKPSMSIFTALSLSLNNLFTKKARTILTSFAGSIGIIGIALILSLSSGVQIYINRVEEDTLSSYPIAIEQTGTDISELAQTLMGDNKSDVKKQDGKIYSNDIMSDMITSMVNGTSNNDLAAFKKFAESGKSDLKQYTSDIKYGYSTVMNIYTESGYKVNPSSVFEDLGFKPESTQSSYSSMNGFYNSNVWKELIDNDELIDRQYEVITGRKPKNYDEAVVIVDENDQISDYTLYTLGLKDSSELKEILKNAMEGKKQKVDKQKSTSYTYDEILSLKFKLLLNTDYYSKNADGTYTDNSSDELYILDKLKNSQEIKIVGILRSKSKSAAQSGGSTVGYLSSLTEHLINEINGTEIVKAQKENEQTDIFTGMQFPKSDGYTMDELNAYIANLPADQQAQFTGYIQQLKAQGQTDAQIVDKFSSYLAQAFSGSSYDENMSKLGVSDIDSPSTINIYPKDFESKEKISDIIKDYNKSVKESEQITYTDYIGLLLSSVTKIINAISYVLIAFVSISLVVSSIMIGIITYISVLERTKEIGILRAMGASKHDVSRVFNAETLIEGFTSGILGIGITLLLLIPINAVIRHLTNIEELAAVLPVQGAVILILISMFLTFIAGLIPSRMAAKRDPVTALRSE